MADGAAAPLFAPFDAVRFADLCHEVFEAAARTQGALLRLQRAAHDGDELAMARELSALGNGISAQADAGRDVFALMHVEPAPDDGEESDHGWAES